MRPDALERMVTQKGGSAEVAVSGTLDSVSEKNGWCTMILTGVEVEDESVRKVLISCKSDLLEKCEEKILPPCGSQIHLLSFWKKRAIRGSFRIGCITGD